ncbi:trypsin-1-like [Neocloeon triangulifer]|uniref:trypsin-1-like n=1 Tax=Neocloeon triangulifer TaxID=2078957 RepID=UPI00286F24D7|nr:trypsin-1-like [Neocloeon triangulifer]
MSRGMEAVKSKTLILPPSVVTSSPGNCSSTGEISGEDSVEDIDSDLTCNCKCGIAKTRARIVGGQETRVNQYPWMALLSYNGEFLCGGTLINNKYILTAAHCLTSINMTGLKITLLEHDRSSSLEAKTIDRSVTKIIAYNKNLGIDGNDIALLKMDKEVPLKGDLLPACMPTPGKTFTNEDALVIGWGRIGENKPLSAVLMEVAVPIMSNLKCQSYYGASRITDNTLCAGVEEGGRDSCEGDSGGPLMVKNKAQYQIVGVVSWGEGCARPKKPGVYARVNRYLTWIKSNTADSCYCKL